MTCFQPAPDFYVFVMHNLHFLSTPVYLITMLALIRESSQLFQKYKYYLIVHLLANFLSEGYVTFMWLPMIHLPYEVYQTTGWLAEWDVSGICQFMALGLFVNLIGISILEMFYHRFKAVVVYPSQTFTTRIPTYCLNIFRLLSLIHILAFVWGRIDNRTLIYQEKKKEALFKKDNTTPEDLGCFTVVIAVPEDPVFLTSISIWGVLVVLGLTVIFSSVILINNFLKTARTLSSTTKKLQRMLVISLIIQAGIHGFMIALPVGVQLYDWIFIIYDNNGVPAGVFCILTMPCFQPAPYFYAFFMHNLHFISTPVYLITMLALIRETSDLFQKYKYYLIVHLIANIISEGFVTFLWLPTIRLPYPVYLTTGWLAEWGVSGIAQFMALGLFVNLIGISILEMFYHRFKAVVVYPSQSCSTRLPTYCLNAFRLLTIIHLLAFAWGRIDNQTLIYQEQEKEALFKKDPNTPKDLGCFTVSIVVPQDPIFLITVSIWGILVVLALTVIFSTVVLINNFLKASRFLSSTTKKLQIMLVISLVIQAGIHGSMIALPVGVQLYSWVSTISDNNFGMVMLFFVAYHGFFSTCAMIAFTKQIRVKIYRFFRKPTAPVALINQIGPSSTNISSIHN